MLYENRYMAEVVDIWCRSPGSNRDGLFSPRDFKSLASACSATPACLLYRGVLFSAVCVLLG